MRPLPPHPLRQRARGEANYEMIFAGMGAAGTGTAWRGRARLGWARPGEARDGRSTKQRQRLGNALRRRQESIVRKKEKKMQLTLKLTGTTPLLCHNARLVDPDDDIVRDIKLITSKKKKTDEDRKQLGWLEFMGGLYVSDITGVPVMPTANIRRCLVEAGKTRKLGKQIGRAATFMEFETPLIYDGPKEVAKLASRPEFRHRAVVRNQANRIIRVRLKFPQWELVTALELIEELLDPQEFRDIANLAGMIEGLGDNRVNGFGRFTVDVLNA